MEQRLGFVGIVVENRQSVPMVNEILSSFGGIIQGRIGVPNHESGVAVIGLIVNGTGDQLGAMTGQLGNLPGVQVKSALTAAKKKEKEMESR
ncbi:MAG: TM1266 family iron-only hydrogenase system putative regulator [Candidatus Limiplasma sp.]|nr:iron-only hydrogenase system regulator [Clostridiales bacterium]MDY3815538.1 TM1266 family iron-only hydrogenase system putative regulator [Candidatus Limiplasma sp.]